MSLPSEPITRKEQYLAKAAGQAVEIPAEPITREEAYLDAIAKGSGGGGGGTSDYSQLTNKPQINGNTLVGNKTASQLGLASSADLEGKVDKVEGYGLSENDYTDADKASVATIAGKQNALTTGKYIDIDANNEISVDREVPDEAFTYTIQQTGDGIVKITKTVSGAVVFEETYNGDADVTLDALHYVYNSGVQSYTLLIASDTHDAGFKQVMSWWQRVTYTENFSTVDHSGEKLIIKSELDSAIGAIKDGQSIDSFADVETALSGKQDALTFDDTPTDNSNNPVKSNGIYDALATKQNATDNSLDTDAKTIVGAINEHEGDISSLMSGLTNATTVSSGTITPQEGVTITNYRLQKSLKTVYLYMLVKFTPTLGTEQLLCILPSGYRAQDRILFVGKNGTNGKLVACETDSYGAVRVYPTSDDSTAVPTDYFLTITYFTS